MFYFRNLHDSKVTAVHFTQANKAHHSTPQDVLPALIVEQQKKEKKRKKEKPQQHNTTTDNTNNALLH